MTEVIEYTHMYILKIRRFLKILFAESEKESYQFAERSPYLQENGKYTWTSINVMVRDYRPEGRYYRNAVYQL